MKKLFVMSLCIIISSCFKTEIVQFETANTDPATFANGQQLPKNYNLFSDFKIVRI
ncbi:hypothetical protein N9S18_01960 [Flavobacteriaceae bacterium]|jgi:hypothetical protein|nr:hypothetical protein [Flavobacteriaceae bacterium]